MFYLTTHSTHFYLRLYGVRHMVKDQSDSKGRKEMFYLTMHSTHFYLRLYGVRHMVKDQSDSKGRREMFYLTMHSTHFYLRLYGIIQIARVETCCRHMGYSFRLTARILLYAPSHRQDNTYHGLCYTSREALAGMRNINGNTRVRHENTLEERRFHISRKQETTALLPTLVNKVNNGTTYGFYNNPSGRRAWDRTPAAASTRCSA